MDHSPCCKARNQAQPIWIDLTPLHPGTLVTRKCARQSKTNPVLSEYFFVASKKESGGGNSIRNRPLGHLLCSPKAQARSLMLSLGPLSLSLPNSPSGYQRRHADGTARFPRSRVTGRAALFGKIVKPCSCVAPPPLVTATLQRGCSNHPASGFPKVSSESLHLVETLTRPRSSLNLLGGLKRMASSMHCLHRRIHYERRLHRPSYYSNDDSSFGPWGDHDRLHETSRRGHSLDFLWYEILCM